MRPKRQVIIEARCLADQPQLFLVSFMIDLDFLDRLRQLRSLVPPVTSLTENRDLMIDKVRTRLPTAKWRNDLHEELLVEGSCLVVASDGTLSCAAKLLGTRDRLQTLSLPIAELVEFHHLASQVVALVFGAVPGHSTRSRGLDLGS